LSRSIETGLRLGPSVMSMRAAAKFQHWVTANFKETQLKHMRAGQHVKISVDTYGRKYDGHVVNGRV
jgi:membrane fusion protein, multidrug efflux system